MKVTELGYRPRLSGFRVCSLNHDVTLPLCSVLGEENAMENSKAGLKESCSVGCVRF